MLTNIAIILRPRKLVFVLGGLLLLSIIFNILAVKRKFHPLAGDGMTVNRVVSWTTDSLGFGGVPVALSDNLEKTMDFYQVLSVQVRRNFINPRTFECQITNTLISGEIVSYDRPFQSQDRECRVLEFDGTAQFARVTGGGFIFSVKGASVIWQDNNGSGPLVTAIDHIYNKDKSK